MSEELIQTLDEIDDEPVWQEGVLRKARMGKSLGHIRMDADGCLSGHVDLTPLGPWFAQQARQRTMQDSRGIVGGDG